MPLEVKIPPMGESINSGVLAKWHVKDGDTVKKDQALFELETDKITSEGTAEAAGKISLKVAAGAEVKIGQVVASIDTAASAAAPASPAPAVPAPAEAAKPASPSKALATEDASPAVRRLATETGIDPATLTGTGKAGRVTKGDMLTASTTPVPPLITPELQATVPSVVPPTGTKEGRQTRRKMTPLRQKIAQRLVAAQHEAAMLTTFNEVDMSGVMALRAKYQDDFVKKNGVKLGFMSFFVKAVVHALKEVPAVNAQIDGDTIIENHYYDIGVAVGTEKGLMVPVLRDCDKLSLAGLEKYLVEFAGKAREGKIGLSDLQGGCFTISNGGVYGSLLSTPILNPPQSGILGMHKIQERPVAIDGKVVIRPMMYLALSYDHRVVDGKEAVTFLIKIKEALENPVRLFLD